MRKIVFVICILIQAIQDAYIDFVPQLQNLYVFGFLDFGGLLQDGM